MKSLTTGSGLRFSLEQSPARNLLSRFKIDPEIVSYDEVLDHIKQLTGKNRGNVRRIQAWITHCSRIRAALAKRPRLRSALESGSA